MSETGFETTPSAPQSPEEKLNLLRRSVEAFQKLFSNPLEALKAFQELAPEFSLLLKDFLKGVEDLFPSAPSDSEPAKGNLSTPASAVPVSASAPTPAPEARESNEKEKYSKLLIVGSSTANLMARETGALDLAEDGYSSSKILDLMERGSEAFRGKESIFLQFALNNIASKDFRPEAIIGDLRNFKEPEKGEKDERSLLVQAIALSAKNGAQEVLLPTGVPFDSRLATVDGGEMRRANGLEWRNALMGADFSQLAEHYNIRIRVVDYYAEYAYSEEEITPDLKAEGYRAGDLKKQHERDYEKGRDEKEGGKQKKKKLTFNELIHPSAKLAKQALDYALG